MQSIKRAYVSAVHGFGAGLYGTGLLSRETPAAGRDAARWLHSLFAIYDIEAMVRLDLPWWTFKSKRLIERFLAQRPMARVFEYGAGASTVFLAQRAAEVISVEHDRHWHEVVARKVEPYSNVRLHLVEASPASDSGYHSGHRNWQGHDFRNYVHAIDRQEGAFDLIVIDGRCRAHCLNAALRHVKPDGLILFDNAGRKRYQAAIACSGLALLRTSGLTACLPYPDVTTLLSPSETLLKSLVDT